jgi:hypothetical protein
MACPCCLQSPNCGGCSSLTGTDIRDGTTTGVSENGCGGTSYSVIPGGCYEDYVQTNSPFTSLTAVRNVLWHRGLFTTVSNAYLNCPMILMIRSCINNDVSGCAYDRNGLECWGQSVYFLLAHYLYYWDKGRCAWTFLTREDYVATNGSFHTCCYPGSIQKPRGCPAPFPAIRPCTIDDCAPSYPAASLTNCACDNPLP